MEFDLSLIVNSLPLLLKGAGLTLEITALAVGLGLIIGLFLGLAQLSKNPIFRWPAKVYVDVIRGTPLLIQIFIIYFALPNIIGERIDPYIAAVAACSLNSGAYIAEIFRAGIQSISLGQMRAGLSLGMTYPQTMRYIVLPQADQAHHPAARQRVHRHAEGLLPRLRDRLRGTDPLRPARHCRNLRHDGDLDLRRDPLPCHDAHHQPARRLA